MGEAAQNLDRSASPAERAEWRRLVRLTRPSPRARLAAEYMSRLPSFPIAYPSLRALASELEGCSMGSARRALRELEGRGLLLRSAHHHHKTGEQRSNDYHALDGGNWPRRFPLEDEQEHARARAIVTGLLVAAGASELPSDSRATLTLCASPPLPSSAGLSRGKLDPGTVEQQQSAPPAPPATATPPVPRVTPPLVSAAASAFSTSAEKKVRGVPGEAGHTSLEPADRLAPQPRPAPRPAPAAAPPAPGGGQPAVALSELTRRRLAGALAPPALLAVLAFCARPAHEPLAELGVSALLRALERGPVGNPVGYVCNVIRDELAQRQEAAAARAHDDGDRGSGGEGGELGDLVADLVERLSMPAPDPSVAQLASLERQRQRLVHAIQALPFGGERDRLRDAHAALVAQIRKLRGAHA